MELPAQALERLLSTWPVARLATVAADGAPHTVPIVFCYSDGNIYSPVDGKRKSGRPLRRFANVAANPRVSLLIDHYDGDWTRLWWVRVDGPAQLYTPGAEEGAGIARRFYRRSPSCSSRASSRARPR